MTMLPAQGHESHILPASHQIYLLPALLHFPTYLTSLCLLQTFFFACLSPEQFKAWACHRRVRRDL